VKRGPKVKWGLPVRLGQPENQVLRVRKDQLVHRVRLERTGLMETQGYQAYRARRDSLARLVHKAHLGPLVLTASQATTG
jgi:hypothetical protein